MEYDEFQYIGAPRPFRLLVLFSIIIIFFKKKYSFSWDLKFIHLCAVLVWPYSFQVL